MGSQPAGQDDGTTAEDRARLARSLRDSGLAEPAVSDAIAAVPRHRFLSAELAPLAYQDTALTIKSGAEGIAVSAASQPAMIAIMLGQLRLAPGHRVLEIGVGSGYNAALIAALVGPSGSVVSIDTEADLVALARASLASTGVTGVTVTCGDGALGVPGHAPYDRVIVTAGIWDLLPAWLDQLGPGGRLVAPLSVRGIQLSAAFEHADGHWAARGACRCTFIRLTGPAAGPEAILPLGPQPGPRALVADGPVPDAALLHAALAGPSADVPASSRLRVTGPAELADLDLWLALAEPGLSRLNLISDSERGPEDDTPDITALMPLGGFADNGAAPGTANQGPAGQFAVAALAVPAGDGSAAGGGPLPVTVRGWGPGGAALAARLAALAGAWDQEGRPGASTLELAAYPAGARPALESGVVSSRPHTALVAGWPERR